MILLTYTIGQAAKRMGVTVSTLRYYDKEGLLPFVDKKENGTRVFKDEDFEWLELINCMKNTGASIKEIKQYIDLRMEGDDTLKERLEMFLHRKHEVTQQMEELSRLMETINHKIWYYEKSIEAGTTAIHKGKFYNNKEDLLQ